MPASQIHTKYLGGGGGGGVHFPFTDLGHIIWQRNGVVKSTLHLVQDLTVALQGGHTASITGQS